MKHKISFLAFLMFLLMLGCRKEQVDSVLADQQLDKSSSMVAIPIGQSLESGVIISQEVFENSFNTLATPRTSSNTSVNAHFYPFPGWNVKFEGMQNNSGIRGRGHVMSEFLYIKVKTVCLNFADNEVVYGAEIIEVPFISDEFEAAYPGVIRVGKYMALKLRDNGEGYNAPSDQSSLYFITADFPLCDVFPPYHPIWYGPPFELADVPGQIQVN